jgi:hypothetical protein
VTETSSRPTRHKFTCEQLVEVESELFTGVVEICVHLPGACEAHSAPMYGCSAGDSHFSFCEEIVKPLSDTHRRRMN